jgi:hypothetical protein
MHGRIAATSVANRNSRKAYGAGRIPTTTEGDVAHRRELQQA